LKKKTKKKTERHSLPNPLNIPTSTLCGVSVVFLPDDVQLFVVKNAFCVPSFFVTHPPRLIFSSATKQQHRQLLEFIAEVELELHHHYVWFEYLKKNCW
jgi:hypothetical protein